jgi:hypothetical protein
LKRKPELGRKKMSAIPDKIVNMGLPDKVMPE